MSAELDQELISLNVGPSLWHSDSLLPKFCTEVGDSVLKQGSHPGGGVFEFAHTGRTKKMGLFQTRGALKNV